MTTDNNFYYSPGSPFQYRIGVMATSHRRRAEYACRQTQFTETPANDRKWITFSKPV